MLTWAYSWVWWLCPLPLLVYALWPPAAARRTAVRVSFMPRLQELLGDRELAASIRHSWIQWAQLTLLWLLALAAVARPQWLEPPVSRTQPTRDLLLLVDLSGSMQHEDFTNAAGQTVDRLTAVKEVLADFLEKRRGDRLGLVVFGDAPFVQVPFTTDLALCRQLLDEAQVGMAGPRTALGDAMGLGIKLFEKSDLPTKTMIALTDGNDTASSMPPEKAAEVAAGRGLTIHTIVVGDPTSVGEDKIDEVVLQHVAQTTGGRFYAARDRGQLAQIYTELDKLEAIKVQTISHRPRVDLFPVPLAGLVMVTMAAAAGDLLRGFLREQRDRKAPGPGRAGANIHVNPRTGEMEVSPP